MKNNKGITLLALIITIIVMLILAGVSMTMLFGENGTVTKSQEASDKYDRESKIEKLMLEKYYDNASYDEKTAKGHMTSQATLRLMAEKIIDNELNPDLITIFYDKVANIEYIAYRYDLALEQCSEEEIEKMESLGIIRLMGDVNADGKVDENDIIYFKNNLMDYSMPGPQTYYEWYMSDLSGDGLFGKLPDVEVLEDIVYGEKELEELNLCLHKTADPNWPNRKILIAFKSSIELDDDDFIEYYDKKTKTEHIVYKYDKVISKIPKEDIKNIERVYEYKTKSGYYIGTKMLKGDANLNGRFTLDDINLIEENLEKDITFTSTQITIIDMNNNNKVDEQDIEKLTKVLNGDESMYSEWNN